MSSSLTGLLVVACGVVLTLLSVVCDEFTDENRPYEFGFTIEGQQHRHEKKDSNGIIQGEFGFITADGIYHVTVYATDENGNFKILSMKNIRVSPPLDGSAPYNPTVKGNTGSVQQGPRESTSAAITTRAPGTFFSSPATTPQPITRTTKIFIGCSGCKVPVTDSPQSSGLQPGAQPQTPSGPADTYVSQSPFYSSPGTNSPGGISAPKVTGTKSVTSPNIYGGNVPTSFDDKPQSFPVSGNVQPVEKYTPFTGNVNPTFSPAQPVAVQDFQQSTRSPYDGGRYSTIPPTTITSSERQTPKSVLIFENIFPSRGEGPVPGQNRGSGPPTVGNAAVPNKLNSPPGTFVPGTTLPDYRPGTYPVGVERDGLPPGVSESDIKDRLYKFNYTVGFHGHYETGYRNGDKLGGYFANGRDGFGRNVQYVANEFGYQPNITLVNLGLDSTDTPREDTEKQFGLRGYEFKWFYRR